MPRDTDWRTQAACKNWPNPEDFFTDGEVSEAVAVLCHGCPVRDECFDWAARTGQVGYWGATTEQQREALQRGIRRAKCPACNAPQPFRRDDGQVCGFCGMSWQIKVKEQQVECDACDGTGQIWDGSECGDLDHCGPGTCLDCGGSGLVKPGKTPAPHASAT